MKINIDTFFEVIGHSDIPTIENLCKTSKAFKFYCRKYKTYIIKDILKRNGYTKFPPNININEAFRQLYTFDKNLTNNTKNFNNLIKYNYLEAAQLLLYNGKN